MTKTLNNITFKKALNEAYKIAEKKGKELRAFYLLEAGPGREKNSFDGAYHIDIADSNGNYEELEFRVMYNSKTKELVVF